MRVSVLMGGNSSERFVSIKSGEAVVLALQQVGVDVYSCVYEGNIKDYISKLKDSDVVFLALHGGDGENGQIQKILELEGIVYTGSGPKASALAMDKSRSKEMMVRHNIPTPAWRLFENAMVFKEAQRYKVEFPIVVKPNSEGSTVGLSIVQSPNELKHAVDKASACGSILLEKYIPGRELTVGILGNDVLPCIEILPSHDHYDYECKYKRGMSEYVCPAELPTGLASQLAQSALSIHQILDCQHYSRVDFRLSNENSFFCLEVNTLPGLTKTSLFPKAAASIGVNFEQLIQKLCRMAIDER